MIEYELAKQLKDAGFPLKGHTDCGEYSTCCICDTWPVPDLCIPTLSELIEACGDRFYTLRRLSDGWEACGEPASGLIGNRRLYSKTPEEAVANLWLALNPRKENK